VLDVTYCTRRRLAMVVRKRKESDASDGKKKAAKKVSFKMAAPEAKDVFLVGDFNDWNISANPLKSNSKGIWNTSIKLAPGRYEYRFLIDGEWRNDPNSSSFVPNPFGSENCLLVL
jgi:1,4-alpha-glucan branching enzyme